MDSARTRSSRASRGAAPDDEVGRAPSETLAPVPAHAPSRLARLGPAARGAVRVAWRTSAVGALGAAAVWAALFEAPIRAGTVSWPLAAVVAAVLLVPAAAAAILAWTLGDLVALPGALRDAARGAVAEPAGRGGLFRTVWALRGLATEGAGAWAAAAGLVRLASLPFVLGLLALVALNGVVVAAGVVALVVLVL